MGAGRLNWRPSSPKPFSLSLHGLARGRCTVGQDQATHRPLQKGWIEATAEHETDLRAGRIVSAETVLSELQAASARMMARGNAT